MQRQEAEAGLFGWFGYFGRMVGWLRTAGDVGKSPVTYVRKSHLHVTFPSVRLYVQVLVGEFVDITKAQLAFVFQQF